MKEGIVELDDVLVAELMEDVNLHSKVGELLKIRHEGHSSAKKKKLLLQKNNKKSHLIRLKLADLGCCQPPRLFMSRLVNLKT